MASNKYQATVNEHYSFDLDSAAIESLDIIAFEENKYHFIQNSKSYTVEILHVNINQKKIDLTVDGKPMSIQLADQYDQLVKKMGLSAGSSQKTNEIKAPMPGLVLDIQVEEGQAVQKGDAILILEAMKMENVLKAPNDATIQSILVGKGDTVEKGQLLITLE